MCSNNNNNSISKFFDVLFENDISNFEFEIVSIFMHKYNKEKHNTCSEMTILLLSILKKKLENSDYNVLKRPIDRSWYYIILNNYIKIYKTKFLIDEEVETMFNELTNDPNTSVLNLLTFINRWLILLYKENI